MFTGHRLEGCLEGVPFGVYVSLISSCKCLKYVCCVSKSASKVCGRCLGSICKVYEGGLKNGLKNEDE